MQLSNQDKGFKSFPYNHIPQNSQQLGIAKSLIGICTLLWAFAFMLIHLHKIKSFTDRLNLAPT